MRETLSEIFQRQFNKIMDEHPDIKQVDVAKAIGVSSATISEWRKGRKSPRIEKVKMVAAYFSVDVDYFFATKKVPDYSPDMLNLIEIYSDLTPQKKEMLMNYIKFLRTEQ